jgi:hypothetical protein
MSAKGGKIMAKQKLTTQKTEVDLEAERRNVLEQVAAIDQELAGIAEKHAMELAAYSPNEQRLEELEEIRTRFTRERERLVGRANALADLAIPAAKRRASHETMVARVAEYERQLETISKGNALIQEALTTLRRVKKDFPWGEHHPAGKMEGIAEEIFYDAGECGEEPPKLEKAPSLPAGELDDLLGIARFLVRRAQYLRSGWPGPKTARGRAAARAKQEAQRAEAEHRYAVNAARAM